MEMITWLSKLIQKKLNGETNEERAVRRVREAYPDFDRERLNPPSDRNESRIEAARRVR